VLDGDGDAFARSAGAVPARPEPMTDARSAARAMHTPRRIHSGRNCGPAEAVRIGLAAAGGKNLEVFSPTIGRQLLQLGLIDEIDLHIAPILLGEGIRLYDNHGSEPIRLHRVGEGHPTSTVNVRYRPTTTAKIPTERPS